MKPQRTIFKSSPAKNFVVLPNALVRDRSISFRARGLLAMVLSNSEEWRVNKGWIASNTEKEGRDAVNNALSELREVGYVVFFQRHSKSGHIENVWEFHDSPGHVSPDAGLPVPGKPSPGKPAPSEGNGNEETFKEEKGNRAVALLPAKNTKETTLSPARKFSDAWCKEYEEKFRGKYAFQGGRDGKAVSELIKFGTPEELIAIARKAWSQTDPQKFWSCINLSSTISKFLSGLSSIRVELSRAEGGRTSKGKVCY